MYTLKLSPEEAQVLKQLLHIAVQARGMEVAEAAVVLVKRLDDSKDVIQEAA